MKRLFFVLTFIIFVFDVAQADAAFMPLIADTNVHKVIAAGASHSLALKSDGTVWAWGYNSTGQLGNDIRSKKIFAVQVSGIENAIDVSSGWLHSLALKSDGTIWAWGGNQNGQLGDGTINTPPLYGKYMPVKVRDLTEVVDIAGGWSHSLALKRDGTVWAWGSNFIGQLGNGIFNTISTSPIQVRGENGDNFLNDIIAIAAGGNHSLALKSDGTVWAWGVDAGQLGDGSISTIPPYSQPLPVQVKGENGIGFLTGVIAIAAGGHHSLALKSDGTVWAWGYNSTGQLGDGTITRRPTPVKVSKLTNVISITAGTMDLKNHSLAIKSDGTVWAWGYNSTGQLGDGTNINRNIPVQVNGLNKVLTITAGTSHSLAIKSDGTVWAWGSNLTGQLGDGTYANQRLIPTQVLQEEVDATAPDTDITYVIDGNGNQLSNNNQTISNSAVFSFTGSDNASVTGFECSLDDVAFSACASPQSYSNISPGGHTFQVRAKDAAGNTDATPAIFSWTVTPAPVILLPGILGSWTDGLELFKNTGPINQNTLSLTEESQSWFLKQVDNLGYLPHTWQDLKTKLPELGYEVYKCPYDWRNNNQYIAQNYLIPCIDKAKQETGASKVNIVAHSMGGLVARSYIQNDSLYRNDIDKFVMFGTPNHGSANAYYPWEGGRLLYGFGIFGEIMEKTVIDRLFQMGAHFTGQDKISYVHNFFPSIKELLPTFDYLKDQDENTRSVSGLVWQNNLLPSLNLIPNVSKLASRVAIKIFAGEGINTIENIKVLYPNPFNVFSDPEKAYPDGQPAPFLEEKNNLGDETVLSQKSAKITEADIPFEAKTKSPTDPENFLEHTNLPNSFFNEAVSFLGGQATSTSIYSPNLPKEILAISLASPAELLVIDPQGRRLGFDNETQAEKYEIPKGIYSGRDEMELAAIIDPVPGEYKITIIGNGAGEFNTGISYTKEGCADSISQDNYGRTNEGDITTFTINLRGGCGEDAVSYSLDSNIDIDPNTLNLSSNGSDISAYIELPDLYKVEDINISTIKLNNKIPAELSPSQIGDYDNDGVNDLMVKFDRDETEKIATAGENRLTVSGDLKDGTRFEGADLIRVIENKSYLKRVVDWILDYLIF